MRDATVTFTLRDKDITAVLLAKWVWNVIGKQLSLPESLAIAKQLQGGQPWVINRWLVMDYEGGPCDFIVKDDQQDYWTNLEKRWAYQSDLLKRGAAGDAEAAIEYCRLEQAGEISHGAMG